MQVPDNQESNPKPTSLQESYATDKDNLRAFFLGGFGSLTVISPAAFMMEIMTIRSGVIDPTPHLNTFILGMSCLFSLVKDVRAEKKQHAKTIGEYKNDYPRELPNFKSRLMRSAMNGMVTVAIGCALLSTASAVLSKFGLKANRNLPPVPRFIP